MMIMSIGSDSSELMTWLSCPWISSLWEGLALVVEVVATVGRSHRGIVVQQLVLEEDYPEELLLMDDSPCDRAPSSKIIFFLAYSLIEPVKTLYTLAVSERILFGANFPKEASLLG
jgi:hypothetical protein